MVWKILAGWAEDGWVFFSGHLERFRIDVAHFSFARGYSVWNYS